MQNTPASSVGQAYTKKPTVRQEPKSVCAGPLELVDGRNLRPAGLPALAGCGQGHDAKAAGLFLAPSCCPGMSA